MSLLACLPQVCTDAGLTLPGLEPTIYHTWGKQANNDITDAGLISDVIVSLFASSVVDRGFKPW
jgi:hypothetical protein